MNTYLFDFDGTLVDSVPTYVAAMLRVLDEHNISYGDDIVRIITPLGLYGSAKYYNSLGINKTPDELVATMKEYMLEGYRYHVQAKSNVIPVLKQLKAEGASINVLTASPHLTMDACLKRLELFDLFDNVWSCEDFGTTKADPNIYKMVAEKLGQPVEEILFLDDNLNADKTAKMAGMKVCGVFDPSAEGDAESIQTIADFYIYDFAELPKLKIW